ncbi:MAG: hypothetical protein JEZ00_17275 [Anaerolineaceae bacterium]|nr:hypothetical protein [Anaerolineaceae bacterium]
MVYSIKWVNDFIYQVENELITKLADQKKRFPKSNILIDDFHKSAKILLNMVNKHAPVDKIRKSDKQLKTKRNELCVAYEILNQKAGSYIEKLKYEPSNPNTNKKIDFHATTNKGESFWIEVKTIHPDDLGEEVKEKKWNAYLNNKNFFSPRTDLIIDYESGGAEIWHDYSSARSHMLDYAIDFETRIEESKINDKEICILAIVGNGYHWRKDHLEDFVPFYHGHPRSDDVFAKMQEYYIEQKGIN